MKLSHKSYGSGDPLIILHGLFGLGDNWRTIARMMEDDVQSILVDLRNHGRSPHDDVMNFQVMADDVMELIDDLEQENVSVMGHSLGGKVAMQMATQYPESIEKLIVVDMAPKVYPPHHSQVIKAIQAVHPETTERRDELEETLRTYLGTDESTVQFLMKNLSRRPEGGFEWKPNMPVIIASYDELMKDIHYMHPYLGPTLFVRGANSSYVQDEDLSSIKAAFPEAELVTIPDAGHWIHADNPSAFVEVIRTFLFSA